MSGSHMLAWPAGRQTPVACLSLTARPRGHDPAMGGGALPELCVFDLDACLWDKEMFQMSDVPEPRFRSEDSAREAERDEK
mgnify:CR=1 FL=1